MSKRKPDVRSKRARRPKIAARAQHKKQAVVRSAKENPRRSVAAGSEPHLKLLDDSERKTAVVENRAAALHDGLSQGMRDNNPKKGFVFSLPTASVQAYQATLLEMTQANMHFAVEFGQRLATIRSPFEFFAVIAEFTSRQMDIVRKYSKKQMVAYPLVDASRGLNALTGP